MNSDIHTLSETGQARTCIASADIISEIAYNWVERKEATEV